MRKHCTEISFQELLSNDLSLHSNETERRNSGACQYRMALPSAPLFSNMEKFSFPISFDSVSIQSECVLFLSFMKGTANKQSSTYGE